jgi:hypothetical protein
MVCLVQSAVDVLLSSFEGELEGVGYGSKNNASVTEVI